MPTWRNLNANMRNLVGPQRKVLAADGDTDHVELLRLDYCDPFVALVLLRGLRFLTSETMRQRKTGGESVLLAHGLRLLLLLWRHILQE